MAKPPECSGVFDVKRNCIRLTAELASNEDGAVTVDWVVLTAGVVALGAMAVAAITGNLGTVGSKVSSFMASQTISSTF